MSPDTRDDPRNDSARGESPAVLIAEDDVLVRMGISDFMRMQGFTVLEAATIVEAKSLVLAGAPVDLVFSDINLGQPHDGIELALWIEARRPELPIVMTSAGSDVYRTAALACASVRRFLRKPYDYTEVEALLRALIETPRKSAGCK
jgi:DNA-binding response OmpR family regulator